MHHRGGAYSETQYIYGPAVRGAFQSLREPKILSVGLGAGYNEILTACEALRSNKGRDFYLQSFESDDFLREEFLRFIQGQDSLMEEVYRDICQRFEISVGEVQNVLAEAHQDQRWRLQGALMTPDQIRELTHVYLWDAFSQKTSPALWTEEFLIRCLEQKNPEGCWLGTYACNAALKSALKKQNLAVVIRPGFQGKRECTWGLSGIFSSFETP